MKRIFALLAITILATLSYSVSAQSIIGKWSCTAGPQVETMKAMGSTIEKSITTQTFNDDSSYETYVYMKLHLTKESYSASILIEYTEHGTYSYANNTLTYFCNNIDFKSCDIQYDDPSLNAIKSYVEESVKGQFEQVYGGSAIYHVTFISDNEANLKFENDVMPIEFNIIRTE